MRLSARNQFPSKVMEIKEGAVEGLIAVLVL